MRRAILGAILCGGTSRRMGADKGNLKIRPGVSQLDYLLGLVEPFCERRVVCLGPGIGAERELPDGVVGIRDPAGLGGPMAGLIAALREAKERPVLLLACDMPFLEPQHLVQLLNRRDPDRLATAFAGLDGLADPMCAVYEGACLRVLEGLAKEGKASLRRFLLESDVELVEAADPQFLASVNDLDALAAARDRLGG